MSASRDRSEIAIREALPGDAAAIGDLWEEFMGFHERPDPRFARAADGLDHFLAFVSEHIRSGTSCVLVAQQGDETVGYCPATLDRFPPVFASREHGAVLDLAVTESCRRRGIGRRLCRRAEVWFAERGVQRIEVGFAASNRLSGAFWRQMGFRPYMERAFKRI